MLTQHGFFSTRLEHIHTSWPYYNKTGELIKCPLDAMCDIIIHGHAYRLKKPRLSPKQALLQHTTYSSQLFVPVQFNVHPTNEMFVHWFLLANLPLMTKQGHFIVNGSPRMIMSQMVRCPGVYFKKTVKPRKTVYIADIIAHRGTWLRLEIDSKAKRIWAKMKRLNKIAVSRLISDLGLNAAFFEKRLKTIAPSIGAFTDQAIFNHNFIKKAEQMEAFLEDQFPWPRGRIESRNNYFHNRFANPSYYSLSKAGRNHLNRKLGLQLPLAKTLLTGEDVLLTCCRLIEFYNGDHKESDIDDLNNRKIRSTGELIQMQITLGLLNLQQSIKEKLNKKKDLQQSFWKTRLPSQRKSRKQPNFLSLTTLAKRHPSLAPLLKKRGKRKLKKVLTMQQFYDAKKAYFQNLISSAPLNSALKTFFGTNPLSQFLDQTNPLSQLTHIRRLSSLGEGGINRENATMAMRGIHPSHYGRICPIETPEGQNAGLVNSFTNYALLNSYGGIETPLYKVHEGIVLKDQRPQLFAPEHEKNFVIAPGDTSLDTFNCLPQKIDAKQASVFAQVNPQQIHFMSLSPLQMISVATSLIPFLEHDDGNRALMGSNMQRQAVPTLIPNAPIVGTGFESKIIADSNYGVQAKTSGRVIYVDNQRIEVITSNTRSSANQIFKPILKISKQSYLIKPKNFFLTSSDFSKSLAPGKLLSNFQEKPHARTFRLTLRASKVSCWVNPIWSSNANQIGQTYKTRNKVKKLVGSQFNKMKVFLKAQQIQKCYDLNYTDELRNLTLIFSWLTKQIGTKNSGSPWLRKSTLHFIEKTFNESYIMHHSLYLLKEFFWHLKQSYLPNLLVKPEKKNLKNKFSVTKNKKNPSNSTDQIGAILNRPFYQTLTKLQQFRNVDLVQPESSKSVGLMKLKTVDTWPSKSLVQKLLLKKRVQADVTCWQLNLNTQNEVLTPFWLKHHSAHLGLRLKAENGFSDSKPRVQPGENTLTFKTFKEPQLQTRYGSRFKHQNLIKKISTVVNPSSIYSMNLTSGSVESLKPRFIKSKDLQSLKQKNCKPGFTKQGYVLDTFSRSNQDTVMRHKPNVSFGQWVEKGDLLADNLASCQGELSIGQNLLVGYTPWDGYNFEDAVLMSQRTVSEDLFTSIHIECYEINIKDTSQGREKLTYKLPPHNLDVRYLGDDGIIPVGSWVEEGDVLVGKVTPIKEKFLTPYEQLLYDIIGQSPPELKDSSLRVPANVHGRVIHVERVEAPEQQVEKTLFNSKVKLTKTRTDKPKHSNFGFWKPRFKTQRNSFHNLVLKNQLEPSLEPVWNLNVDFTRGVVFPEASLLNSQLFQTSKPQLNFLLNSNHIKKRRKTRFKGQKFAVEASLNKKLGQSKSDLGFNSGATQSTTKIKIYIAEQRKIQTGDKIAGRHGNKGIISAIVPREDMPYLPDGTMLDLVLNPLGVPSRMNVGQVFECLLGLAGSYLNQNYKIKPFDEIHGLQASRSLVYSKLYEARLKTNHSWLFNPNTPGKVPLFDGRTGHCFDQPVTVGKAYILKLIHLVDEKIHARSTGPYSLVTQQPLRGRSSQGGQRVGEMEVWAFEGFGAAYILQELLTIKSDDIQNRKNVTKFILKRKSLSYGLPESFNLLMSELQGLCLKVVVGKKKSIPLVKNSRFNLYELSLQAECMNFSKKKLWPFKKTNFQGTKL